MKDLLFDTPWWLLGLLIVGGVAMFWSGNNRQDKTLKSVGLAILALGVVLGLTSYFVDTDVESVTKKSKSFVYAAEKRDWETFESILDDRTSLAFFHNKVELLRGAKSTVEAIGLKSVHIIGTTVEPSGSSILVNMKVLSEQERTSGQPVTTSWRFDWQDHGTGFKLVSITPLTDGSVKAEDIVKNLSPIK